MSLIQGRTGDWEIVIGLEVHAQVTSKSKLFSGASTEFGAAPNTQVSLVDAAMPGMLPVINEKAVEQAVRTGLGLNAEIHLKSIFDRKNYFYPDLPQGYQISQYLDPVVGKGEIEIDLEDGSSRTIGITRLHLEQDAGKSIHDQDPRKTLVDLNRSGVALMEIVSEPDMRTAEEAGAYVEKIRSILRYLGTCDGNMQEGSLRADVNVSVRKPGDEFGTRAEIKNVNSIRFIRQAIEYEARRQIELIEDGGEVDQETRLFDPDRGETRSMRSKEEAHDYRYFPDPDLLPLEFEQSWVDAIRETLPELPDQKKHRFRDDYGLSVIDAGTLVAERETAEFFEAVAEGRDAKVAANWVMGELFGALNRTDTDITASPVSAAQLGQLVDLIGDGTVSNRLAKDVFEIMFETGD
ncbi:MAG: Asp-tRNA(Asn)/Glu-tRNA(Gln) amidotransferase subunit GatB, partial [Alphaproteobacteria bacterium]